MVPVWVATVALGYADGYPRHASDRAAMLVRGKSAPVLGRVCMDLTTENGTVPQVPGSTSWCLVRAIHRGSTRSGRDHTPAAASGPTCSPPGTPPCPCNFARRPCATLACV